MITYQDISITHCNFNDGKELLLKAKKKINNVYQRNKKSEHGDLVCCFNLKKNTKK